jgi:hypothetical protein
MSSTPSSPIEIRAKGQPVALIPKSVGTDRRTPMNVCWVTADRCYWSGTSRTLPAITGQGVARYGGGMNEQRCPGCGAMTPRSSDPVHAYVPASPGCWSLFCSLTEWMQSLGGGEGRTAAQWVVDSYMVQHANSSERRNRQSVAVHLMSLCASLEHQIPGDELRSLLGAWTHHDYPEILPRPLDYDITVVQIVSAADSGRQEAVGAWATTVWEAWAQHHDVIRAWLTNSVG